MGRPPEFSVKTRELLAKRSGNMCSNPDCRKITTSSNSNGNRATSIGEAAHIYGARANSSRFKVEMTDRERAQITNSIWLCNTCHKRIDDDPQRYTAPVLFRWREMHDAFTIQLMDNSTDLIKWKLNTMEADEFEEFPPIVRRIVLDRPDFWEGELTKELLDYFLLPINVAHTEIRSGCFVPDTYVVQVGKEAAYLRRKMAEAGRLVAGIRAIYTQKLVESWGAPGESGDPKRILHVCKLIERTVQKMVDWEAELEGIFLEDEDFVDVFATLKGAVGRQLAEILKVNEVVAEIVERVRKMKKGDSLELNHMMIFDLPSDFNDRFDAAIEDVKRKKGLL